MQKKKKIALVTSIVLATAVAVGGTLAYLQDTTDWYSNTFEFVDGLRVTLNDEATTYKIVPGKTQTKNTSVTVSNEDVDCYCFAVVKEQNTTIDGNEIVQWDIADGWTRLAFAAPDLGWESILPADTDISEDNTFIYYREVEGSAEDTTFNILKDNQVKYPLVLDKEDVPDGAEIKLNFAARAVQKEGFADAEKAWIGEEERMPNASMESLDPSAIGSVTTMDGNWTGDLDAAVSFISNDTPDGIAEEDFKDWMCDFVLTFNKDINTSDVFIFGQYDLFGPDWVGGPLGGGETLSQGNSVLIINDWLSQAIPGVAVSYSDVVDLGTFNCGVAAENAPDGLVATLQLIMTDGEGNVHVINTQNIPVA